MFNHSGIKKESAGAPAQILFNVQNQVSVPVIVDKDIASVVTENGRKILKAGTPLAGDLTNRATAFTAAADGSGEPVVGAKPAVGILLHDVDVTDSNGNGSLLIWGFVNLNRMTAATAALVTATRKAELDGKVYFLKD